MSAHIALLLESEEAYNLAVSVEKEDKIRAMNMMITLIDDSEIVSENQRSQFNRYILKYAPYVDDSNVVDYYNEISNTMVQEYEETKQALSTRALWTYSSTAAINYATTNYNSYNSNYPNCSSSNIGGDCTNFVSQCLYAGGIPMNGSWYVYKLNSSYPAPTTIAQLDYSWDLADPSSWISAVQFNAKWYPIFSNETFTGSYVYNNQVTVYNKSYYKGDVVQILKANYWWYEAFHTMIITGYKNSDFTLTYHSTNTIDKPLNTIAASYTSSDYQFIFYSVE